MSDDSHAGGKSREVGASRIRHTITKIKEADLAPRRNLQSLSDSAVESLLSSAGVNLPIS